MASPALAGLKQQIDDLTNEYAARFAGHSRVTRDLAEIESLASRSRDVLQKLEALPKAAKDEEFDVVHELAKSNFEMYQAERTAIADAKASGPAYVEFASLGTQANFVFARYRRHFAGKSRATRDIGLLNEMVDDLSKIQVRMRTLIVGKSDTGMETDAELVTTNHKLYTSEKAEILKARDAATKEEQGDILAEVANNVFATYQAHFASKARITRRPELLSRLIESLKQTKDKMEGLKKGGLETEHNTRNIGVVEQNITMYESELKEIRKARAGVKLGDLMGNLGTAANDVMTEYRENFAGKDRASRDVDLISKLADQLGEVLRQMSALARAEKNEMNARNMQIVTDNLVMLDSEHDAIVKAKEPTVAS